jgi:phage shock protein PspC (stress-responsive transcriptional regulator)
LPLKGANMQHVDDQRFFRSNNRILGGVCAGLAEGFHVDALWVRVAFLLLVFLQGVGVFIYVILWLVMPERLDGGGQRSGFDAMTADLRRIWGELQGQLSSSPRTPSPSAGGVATSQQSPAPSPDPAQHTASAASGPAPQGTSRNQTLVFGLILVIVGLGILGSNVGIIDWAVVWPAALITLGVVILVRNLERKP